MAWREVADACRSTTGKEDGSGEPSSKWKYKMLLAEHSPIRLLRISYTWEAIKYWVSVHLVRHKIGIEHFVESQRVDRTCEPRDKKPQDELVRHRIHLNAQACINISRKRLCRQASLETQHVWREFVGHLSITQPEVARACVPECLYRGFCPELKSCGYSETNEYKQLLQSYRDK